ncbi:hypothetical protein [Massilia sp. Dwa41.01b]|uniref:hypothetical protein n=1 Tax=Massilia sp. Dwa41.01b TaxID=2709302 RepID=UPI001E58ACA1|nr:hypothetical protein [Massilia sp. Dwa41.01b]
MTLCLLVVDLATGFGLWWRTRVSHLLGGAALAGVVLSGFAIYQAVRAPAVVEYEVVMKDLPLGLDGTVLVALSDLHRARSAAQAGCRRAWRRSTRCSLRRCCCWATRSTMHRWAKRAWPRCCTGSPRHGASGP